MAKALSIDLRHRVVDALEQGLSCRQAAERFGVSASSAIRWLDQLKKQGNLAAKRQGGEEGARFSRRNKTIVSVRPEARSS